jgi:hypothetical protein
VAKRCDAHADPGRTSRNQAYAVKLGGVNSLRPVTWPLRQSRQRRKIRCERAAAGCAQRGDSASPPRGIRVLEADRIPRLSARNSIGYFPHADDLHGCSQGDGSYWIKWHYEVAAAAALINEKLRRHGGGVLVPQREVLENLSH